jgi:hypothetical protein
MMGISGQFLLSPHHPLQEKKMATPTNKRIQHCPIPINKPPSLLHHLTHRGLRVLIRSICSMGLLKELKMRSLLQWCLA